MLSPKETPPSAAPLKYHLIGVTAHVYRVWSGFRAAQINNEWTGVLLGRAALRDLPKWHLLWMPWRGKKQISWTLLISVLMLIVLSVRYFEIC